MKKPAPARLAVNQRRAYFESRHGQLHVRTAFPSTGGFDERTSLVMLHDCPLSSRAFADFVPLIGTDRSVYAADLPGYGESDPPAAAPAIADYAEAIGDFLDSLRLRQFDLLGHGVGAAVAAELAIQRPAAVRRIVCVGLPVYSAAERQEFQARPYPAAPLKDGGHFAAEWTRVAAASPAGRRPADISADVCDALRPGTSARWGTAAARNWPARERLPLVASPMLVLRPHEGLWEATARAEPLLPAARWEALPAIGAGLFTTATDDLAARLRAFLDA